jgi:hypothetical protein
MENKYMMGYDVGVLVMKSWVPKPPGHISCASNYNFPIYYLPVENTNNKSVHGGSEELIPNIISSSNELKEMGCKSLATSCGYFGHYQKVVANAGIMPTYLSAVCMAPTIFRLMGYHKKLLVVCYNKEKLTDSLMEACGLSKEMMERIYIEDVINEPELGKIIKDCGSYNIDIGKREVVEIVKQACNQHLDIGAVLLECTDLPPHAAAIQAAVNLPIFDATSMIKFIQSLTDNGDDESEIISSNCGRDVDKVQKFILGGV